MPPHILRRIGGVLLVVAGLALLSWPAWFLVWGSHQPLGAGFGQDPKMLTGLTYQISLGLMVGLIGLYLLTRTPKPKI